MKFKSTLLSLIIFCSFFLVIASDAAALDITAGGSVWYAAWKPAFFNYLNTESAPTESIDYELKPSILVGPFLSLKLTPELTLSSVFMYGSSYQIKRTTTNITADPMSNYTMKDQMDIEKFDMDSTLSYALNGTFKVFGGVKYQGYKYEDNYYVTMPGIGIVENGQITMDMKSTGPGLGLGVTYPVISSLFLVVQISGIYMYSSFHSNTFGEHKYDIWGWNSSMGLAWFQQSMNTTFSLGGRYQNLKYSKRYSGSFDQNNPTDKDPVAGERDIFYGLTLSATYTFSI